MAKFLRNKQNIILRVQTVVYLEAWLFARFIFLRRIFNTFERYAYLRLRWKIFFSVELLKSCFD